MVWLAYLGLLTIPFVGPRLADTIYNLRVRLLARIFVRRHRTAPGPSPRTIILEKRTSYPRTYWS